MFALRRWSTRHALKLEKLYTHFERLLLKFHSLFTHLGYQRVEKVFVPVERFIKGLFFDSKMCGSCTLGSTGMTCPMNCPKEMRNGPCGGVRSNGNCEIKADMPCVWKDAYSGNLQIDDGMRILEFQPPVNHRLQGSSSWLRELRRKMGSEQ